MSRRPLSARLPAPAVLALLLLIAAGGAVFAAYWATPPAWTVDVGGPFSGALLVTGFYADETAGTERYRWTAGHAEMQFADVGADTPLVVRFRTGDRPATAPAGLVFTLTVNSRLVMTYTLPREAAVYSATVGSRAPGDASVVLAFDVPTFRPAADDKRDLGLKLEKVRVEPAPGAPPPVPPLSVLLWVAAVTLGVYAVLWRALRRPLVAGGAALVVLGLLTAGLIAYRPLLTPWLPPLAAIVGILGLVALGWPVLRRWPAGVDSLADPRGLVAPLLLGALLLGYAAFALSVLPGVAWIGHADYADNAVVARNVAAGRGLVVDYAAQFYRPYPGITHPADTWPLLQPLLIAPFFWLLGAQTWVAKLPNLLLLLALAVAVYRFAGRWWDRRVGVLAALLTLLHPYFFQTVLYPINDLAFTLLALLTIGWAVDAVGSEQWAAGSDEEAQVAGMPNTDPRSVGQSAALDRGTAPKSKIRPAVLAGLGGGLLVWSKGTSGGLVLGGLFAGLVLAVLTTRWAGRRRPRNWRPLIWMAAAAGLVLLPLLTRNLLALGAPFYSTEQYDAWILRFYTGGTGLPWEHIYADYLDGRPLPDRALLLRSYETLYAAVAWGFHTLWAGGVLNGDILDLPVVLGGAAGWLLAPRRLRGLRFAWVTAFGLYGLFVLLAWHYEARYFLTLVPWFYLGTAGFLFWVWDHLRGNGAADSDRAASVGPRSARPTRPIQHSPRAAALLPLAVLGLLWPSLAAIAARAAGDSGPDPFATAGQWVATHLPADAVVMTRNPWEFNWYAQRKAVMIPEGPPADLATLAVRYGVSYLWVGGAGDSPKLRPELAPLYHGQPLPGLSAALVYNASGIYIYRLSPRSVP